MTTLDPLIGEALDYYYDPASIARASFKRLTQVSNGEVVIANPTHPLVFLIDAACCTSSAAMLQTEICTRQQYPYAAQTQEDLYRHMSDKDYAGRFALPATAVMTLMLNETEVLQRMITDPITGVKKITIPRNTEFRAGETIFSIEYPIDIIQPLHGSIAVRWDTAVTTPLLDLSSNEVPWEIRVPATESVAANGRFIAMNINVRQFSILSVMTNINSTGVSGDVALTDQFYYARAYVQRNDGTWSEIRTTHTDQIYDVNTPTVVFKVVDGLVRYSVPQVYISQGLLKSKLRVDVYQTKGALDFDMGSYNATAFGANWRAIDAVDKNVFTAPLDTFNSLQERIIYSESVVSGGRAQLSFEALRSRVLKNAVGPLIIPITPAQVDVMLTDKGYDVVLNVDNVTGRSYLAVRALPQPDGDTLLTPANAGVLTLITTMTHAATTPGVIDNGESVTLTSNVNYQVIDGSLTIVPQSALTALGSMSADMRAQTLTLGHYMRSPYYYVLDARNDNFDTRAYELDNPVVLSKTVVEENDTTQMQVSCAVVSLAKTASGYTVTVVTRSDSNYRALNDNSVFVQLGFYASDEVERAYVIGQLTGVDSDGERRFEFTLRSTFAMTAGDELPVLAQIYVTDDRYFPVNLSQQFDIVFSTTAPRASTWRSQAIDNALGAFQLPEGAYAIDHEQIRVKFGDALTALWTRSRSVPQPLAYHTFTEDIPLRYENDVYDYDQVPGSALRIVNGEVAYNKLHSKGDLVQDASGNSILKSRAGDPVPGSAYSPIGGTNLVRGVVRHADLTVIDGLYWWATDSVSAAYRKKITRYMTSWIVDDLAGDLAGIQARLLDLTRIYFQPKNSIGTVPVLSSNGARTSISAGQSFFVRLTVSESTFKNPALKSRLTQSTIKSISAWLSNTQVVMSDLYAILKSVYGYDVIGFAVTASGDMANYPVLTVTDAARRLGIKKRLNSVTQDLLVVEEDVTMDFVQYGDPLLNKQAG